MYACMYECMMYVCMYVCVCVCVCLCELCTHLDVYMCTVVSYFAVNKAHSEYHLLKTFRHTCMQATIDTHTHTLSIQK